MRSRFAIPGLRTMSCGRRPGIIGPRVLWITALQLPAHLRVGALPETTQILGDLNWPAARREQVQHQGKASVRNRRRVGEAE